MNPQQAANKISIRDIVESASSQIVETNAFPLSDAGFQKLKDEIRHYINDLIFTSAKEAEKHQSDSISDKHVAIASGKISVSSASRRSKLFGAVGGILLGAGLSTILSAALSGASVTFNAIFILVIVATILGAILLTVQLTKE